MSEAVQAARARLWDLVGGPPSAATPAIRFRETLPSPFPGSTLERLVLDLGHDEPVPALFLRPAGAVRPPLVLYAHAHGNDYDTGKNELNFGRRALQEPPYGKALVEAGYAVLCIDNFLFGERPRHGGESLFAKARLLHGDTVFGMMLRDNAAALTLALGHLDVDPGRVAVMGLSMGASIAWWLHALDPRIKVCVDLCCMTDFDEAIDTGGLDGHGLYYSVPGLLKHFSTASIVALGAPRPHLSLNGRHDPLTPEAGLTKIDASASEVYSKAGHGEAWRLETHNCGHQETPAMRHAAMAFLARWL